MSRLARSAMLVNPLPRTLEHYEGALRTLLTEAGIPVSAVDSPSVEVGGAAHSRAVIALESAWSRIRLIGRRRGLVIGLWPALGMLECLLYLPTSLRHDVLLIIHDPIPIRRQFGYSRASRLLARLCTSISPRLRLVTHTSEAAQDLLESTGCHSILVPHPLDRIQEPASATGVSEGSPVRVLGQYKPSRDLGPLRTLGRELGDTMQLEILGRGWPDVEGWSVVDDFLDEDEFDMRIRTASCVVIPYARFYQSGVAARCAELAVPVVGPAHEHIQELFGSDWVGLVQNDADWTRAVRDVLRTDREELARVMRTRRQALHQSWQVALGAPED